LNNNIGGDYITFKYRYRKEIIIGCIIMLFLIIGMIYFIINWDNKKSIKKDNDIVLTKKKKKKIINTDPIYLKVDIKGEVVIPGIYSLEEGSRVIDVINLAGGLTENANTSVINLSKKITDEMVIIVYSNEQINNLIDTKNMEKYLQEKCVEGDGGIKNDACIEDNNENSNSLININTATKEELMSLTGIGESKANDIINYRNNNGPFKSIEEITKVSGIGDNIYSQIKENITV
jgi:competence protein ComEA